ncbi:MAG: saccharopine dehydrogenase C-terminal domain-containing protein, partial [Geminicoccaceae bacterium]
MSDRSRKSGTVHWVGAGLSTGQGLARICDVADRVYLWNRTVDHAEHLVRRLKLDDDVHIRTFSKNAFAAALRSGDIVVSMLPATMHRDLLTMAIEADAQFVSTSYVDDDVRDLAQEAEAKGLAVVMEAGLDPGIDHLAAYLLIENALDTVGRQPVQASFHSHCGGFPAEPNDFLYRFSWTPVGVLRALRSQARFVRDSVVQVAPLPWKETRSMAVRCELFEAYPNRDSLPFLGQYRIPDSWD